VVGLLAVVVDDEYGPEFSTLVVRDVRRVDFPADEELLSEDATLGSGTLACAGNGWLMAAVGDDLHRVALEAHDGRPLDDVAAWSDVLETPYGSSTGSVELTWMTGRPNAPAVELGPPGRYRVRLSRRPADDEGGVWRLQFWPDAATTPPRWLARSEPAVLGDHDRRFAGLAAEVVALARWAPGSTVTTTPAALAERLLVSPDQVRAAVRFAVTDNHLAASGDLQITAVATPRAVVRSSYVQVPEPGPPWNHRPDGGSADQPPWGDPPRAGVVGVDGQVVSWRDGAPTALGRWPGGELLQAVETAHGVVLAGSGAVLARFDGTVDPLADGWCRVAVGEDGRLLAISEQHGGRQAWSALHLVDLATGRRDTVAVEATPVAVYRGAVYLADHAGTARWTPGGDPQPVPYRLYQIDPLTGSRLVNDGAPHSVVIQPDGRRRQLPLGPQALLPGAAAACGLGSFPPSLRVYTLTGVTIDEREISLPEGTVTVTHDAQRPVWEDPHHMVAVLGPMGAFELQAPLLRVDVTTGGFERIRLDSGVGVRALVAPLHRGGAPPQSIRSPCGGGR
jgi:hypothetical protein